MSAVVQTSHITSNFEAPRAGRHCPVKVKLDLSLYHDISKQVVGTI
jgi:hypothetical protein